MRAPWCATRLILPSYNWERIKSYWSPGAMSCFIFILSQASVLIILLPKILESMLIWVALGSKEPHSHARTVSAPIPNFAPKWPSVMFFT